MALRVHRAISWIGRAEQSPGDPDAAFLFLWIAFNAAYAGEADVEAGPTLGDRSQFAEYLARVVSYDETERLHDAVWNKFEGPIAKLMQNRYVFRPFWQHQNGIAGNEDWDRKFVASAKSFVRAMEEKQTVKVLTIVFDRLYMLRCQLTHGGATWGGKVNREQLKDGAAILGTLLPVMVDLMLDNPEEDWGRPFYPVIGPMPR
ncbi:hypothetical protein DYI42_05800 [Vannielia litorea]|nr:hypothetical protein [Vannielia litorea]